MNTYTVLTGWVFMKPESYLCIDDFPLLNGGSNYETMLKVFPI